MNDIFYDILPNGVQIVHKQVVSEVAYVGIMVGAGTRDEDAKLNGLAHYIEHCVFKGTKTRTAGQIINQIEGIGGEINAYTTKEETTFYAATPVEHFAHTLHLIADLVLHPTFPKKETDKELQVILDEIESYNDSPGELIYDDFEGLVFAGSELAFPILGTSKTLHKIRQADALEFIQTRYNPEQMVVFSQSKLPMKSVVREVQRCLSETPYINTRAHKREVFVPSPSASTSVTLKKRTHQNHMMLGGLAYPLGHEKQLATYLLNNILGGGALNSRLNMSLREQRGLVYTVESTYTPLSDTGYWSVYFACDPEDQDRCLELVHQQLELIKQQPLTKTQLERAIQQLRGQMAIAAENQENNALAMAKNMLYFHKAPTWQETFAKIAQITGQQLCDVANELFDTKRTFLFSYR
ncbi:MAG: insulinase family protein [Paludibacteraceae bacterium]|nr:insulinase family protein [Paludibacteraceae bacterium]